MHNVHCVTHSSIRITRKIIRGSKITDQEVKGERGVRDGAAADDYTVTHATRLTISFLLMMTADSFA